MTIYKTSEEIRNELYKSLNEVWDNENISIASSEVISMQSKQKLWLSKEELKEIIEQNKDCITGYPHICSKNPEDCDFVIEYSKLKKKLMLE